MRGAAIVVVFAALVRGETGDLRTRAQMSSLPEVAGLTRPHPNVKELCNGLDGMLMGEMYYWCVKAMRHIEANPSKITGLSYGIFTHDEWSRRLSNEFRVKTELFDCFHTPEGGFSFTGRQAVYQVPYKRHSTCVAGKDYVGTQGAAKGKIFQKWDFEKHENLSVMLKFDVEGSEWEALDALEDADFAKIISIDAELHWCMGPNSVSYPIQHIVGDRSKHERKMLLLQTRMAARRELIVRGLKKMAKHMAVTGE